MQCSNLAHMLNFTTTAIIVFFFEVIWMKYWFYLVTIFYRSKTACTSLYADFKTAPQKTHL